jgi:hypothetical protein
MRWGLILAGELENSSCKFRKDLTFYFLLLTEIQIIAAAIMDSKADETTANKLNQMESPEDLDVFVKELMDNMVSISTAFKLSGLR